MAIEVRDSGPPAAGPTITTRPRSQSVRDAVSDAWQGRALARPMAARVVAKTYAKTKLGIGWLFIRPIVDIGSRTLLFGSVLGVEGASNGAPYFLFLLIGLFGWRLFDQTLFWATRGFDRFAKLARRFAFPLLLVPVAATAYGAFELCVYGVMIAIAFAVLWIVDGQLYLPLGPELLLGVLGLLLALGFGLGIALWTSVLNARWRDVRFTLRYLLEIWLYATPVIYPLETLPESVQPVAQINPMTPIVELVKEGFLDSGTVGLVPTLWAVAATLAAMSSGLWFFAHNAARFNTPLAAGDDDDDDDGI
jgi:lipopolysaccharide transport system permease protein